MLYKITRMLSLALAFGIFFAVSCSSVQNSQNTNVSDSDNLSLGEQIREINQQISKNPENTQLQVTKADLLYQYSEQISAPTDRKEVYQNIRDIADSYSSNLALSNQLNEILRNAWRIEKQSGIRLIQRNESGQQQDFNHSVAHFRNAIILIPDSLQTYSLLATTYYQHGKLNQAIEIFIKAELQAETNQSAIGEKLAYLYLEYGDLEEAERRYNELVENNPDELIYKHGLINVLILSDKHQEAIEMLEQLAGDYPTRFAYQESLATELYFLFKNRTEFISSSLSNNQLPKEELEELKILLTSVHSIFETMQESFPTTEENLFRMASFYKNASSRLRQLPDSNEAFGNLEQEFIEYALPLWERLAEINKDNLGYINNLYQVYQILGMQEEAESIERSYNF